MTKTAYLHALTRCQSEAEVRAVYRQYLDERRARWKWGFVVVGGWLALTLWISWA